MDHAVSIRPCWVNASCTGKKYWTSPKFNFSGIATHKSVISYQWFDALRGLLHNFNGWVAFTRWVGERGIQTALEVTSNQQYLVMDARTSRSSLVTSELAMFDQRLDAPHWYTQHLFFLQQ